MAKKVEILIPLVGISTGKTFPKVEAHGYVGESCKTATEAFEKALGSVKEEEVKSEMYATESGVERVQE